jgi:hypothetical protein
MRALPANAPNAPFVECTLGKYKWKERENGIGGIMEY